jgi:hypothetical protein
MTIMKLELLLTLAALVFSGVTVSARTSQDLVLAEGVTPQAKIGDIYRRFSEAHRKLDAEAVTNLYTDDSSL